MTRAWLSTILAVLVLAPAALAQNAQIMSITEAADLFGLSSKVESYHGPLPPPPLSDLAIPQMKGWPQTMGSLGTFSPSRGLALADLEGDGELEIIASSTDSKVYAWDFEARPKPGFPVTLIGWAQYAPTVADMDGDGDLEIIQTTRGQTSGGRLYALNHLGQTLPGFPKSFNNNNIESCATVCDLDNDGRMEIICGERAYPIGIVHIVKLDGTEWTTGWPANLDHVMAATPAVGDVDHDGKVEIIVQSYNSLYVFGVDGKTYPGFPLQIPNCSFSYQSAALADLDGDKDLEIVVGTHKTGAGCYVFHHDGTSYAGWPQYFGTWSYCPPTVADIDDDGQLDILDGRAGFGPGMPSNCFWAWTHTGITKPGFPYYNVGGGGSEGPLTVADIDGDGRKEIFADHNIKDAGGGYLFGVDANGQDLPGFPLRPTGFTYLNGAAIADVDKDGDYELGVLSNEETTVYVNLYDLPDMYGPASGDWPTYHANNARTGLYSTTTPGDLNCDGKIDFGDINPFVLALTDPNGYAQAFPDCNIMNGDINEDGKVDFGDINPFVDLLTQP